MLAFVLLLSQLNAAPPAGGAPAPASGVEARHVGAAKAAFRAHDYKRAIAEFEAAWAEGKNTANLYNLAKCHERARNTARALQYYREYLRLEPTAHDDEVLAVDVANAERRLRQQGAQQLAIFTEPTGAEVWVDGRRVDSTSGPAYIELKAGVHHLIARAPGYRDEEKDLGTPLPGPPSAEVSLLLRPLSDLPTAASAGAAGAAGESAAGPSPLAPGAGPGVSVPGPAVAPVSSVASSPRRRLWSWVTGTLAVAGLATAAGFGVAYQLTSYQLYHLPEGGRTASDTRVLEQRLEVLPRNTYVSLAVAGGLVVAAVITYLLEGATPAPAGQVATAP